MRYTLVGTIVILALAALLTVGCPDTDDPVSPDPVLVIAVTNGSGYDMAGITVGSTAVGDVADGVRTPWVVAEQTGTVYVHCTKYSNALWGATQGSYWTGDSWANWLDLPTSGRRLVVIPYGGIVYTVDPD